MPSDIDARRQRILAAEHAVELQRAHFHARNDARRERWQAWSVPLILGGGALLGLVLGRRGASRPAARIDARGDRHRARDASPAPSVQTAKAAGKAAGLMAGLSLAARLAPVVLPLVQRYVASRRPGGSSALPTAHADWWSVARSVAPLFRR